MRDKLWDPLKRHRGEKTGGKFRVLICYSFSEVVVHISKQQSFKFKAPWWVHLALARISTGALAITTATRAAVERGVSIHPTRGTQRQARYLVPLPQLQLAQLALLTRTKENC